MDLTIKKALPVLLLLALPPLTHAMPAARPETTTSESNSANDDDLKQLIEQFVEESTPNSTPILLEGESSSNNDNDESAPDADSKLCPICQAEIDENSKVFSTSCSHKIHLACVDKWAAECFTMGRSSNDQIATCCLCRSKVTEAGLFGQFDQDCYNELLEQFSTLKDTRKECFRKYLTQINCPACDRPLIADKELIKLAKAPCCEHTYHKPCLYRLMRDPKHHSWKQGEKSLHCLKCKNLKTIAQWKDWLNKLQ